MLKSNEEFEEETVHMLERDEDDEEETPSFKENSYNLQNVCLGGILAFLSGFAYTVQNAVVAKEDISFSEALTVRYLFLIFVMLVGTKLSLCLKKGGKENLVRSLWIYDVDPGQNIFLLRAILPLTGVFGGICILSDFYSVSNMPLGDASAIILSAPLPSMVLSAIFLGARLRIFKIFCGVLLYGGVLLVIRPPFLFPRFDTVSTTNFI